MSMSGAITLIGLLCITGAVIGAILARLKGRSADAWAAWGFFFPPSVLIFAMLPKRAAQPKADAERKPKFSITDLHMRNR